MILESRLHTGFPVMPYTRLQIPSLNSDQQCPGISAGPTTTIQSASQ